MLREWMRGRMKIILMMQYVWGVFAASPSVSRHCEVLSPANSQRNSKTVLLTTDNTTALEGITLLEIAGKREAGHSR